LSKSAIVPVSSPKIVSLRLRLPPSIWRYPFPFPPTPSRILQHLSPLSLSFLKQDLSPIDRPLPPLDTTLRQKLCSISRPHFSSYRRNRGKVETKSPLNCRALP